MIFFTLLQDLIVVKSIPVNPSLNKSCLTLLDYTASSCYSKDSRR